MKQKTLLMLALLLVLTSLIANVSAVESTIFLGDYEVVYSYFNVEEGESFTLTVNIKNTDNENKTDVMFEINDKDPFNVKGDEDWDIGTLGVDEEVTETFRIEVDDNTPEGSYDLEFTLEDEDNDYEDEMEIDVESKEPDLIVGAVATTPLTISPDQEDVKLEITLENLGSGDSTFTRARLILPDGFQASNSYSDTTNIGTIEGKGSKTAVFYIDTDKEITSGIHEAQIELEYKADIEEKKVILDFQLPVKGKPQFDIIGVRTDPSRVPTGTDAVLKITIQNIGEEKGGETSVRVFENADHPISFDEKTSFIGTLEKDESGTAVFDLTIESDGKPNKYLVRVQIRTLQNNNIIVEEHTVPVTVIQGEQSIFSGPLAIVILIVAILIIIYIIYRIVRRGRRKSR